MREFVYSSVLPSAHYDELAHLVFFNRQQERFRANIVHAIERYGVPEIVATKDALRFTVGRFGEVQTLYALDGGTTRSRLAGVMLFARTSPERLVLLHIGVAPEYASNGPRSDRLLVLKLIDQLKKLGSAIKGITQIEILYGPHPTVIELGRQSA
jgi:hypothetical protein